MDYAANAVVYWPVEQIQAKLSQRCEKEQTSAKALLLELLESEEEIPDFWQRVKTNLLAGRIRMVFVADEIPVELRRVIEFLNDQMNPAEVLAVEIKQFVGEGMRSLVPRLLGQTVATQQKKSGEKPKQQKIDKATFLQDMLSIRGEAGVEIAKKIIVCAEGLDLQPNYNKWSQSSSFIPIVNVKGSPRYPVSVSTNGSVWIQMRWLKDHAPFNDEGKREELRQKLNQLLGFEFPSERMTGLPSVPLELLSDEKCCGQLLDILTWIVTELRAEDE